MDIGLNASKHVSEFALTPTITYFPFLTSFWGLSQSQSQLHF